MKDKSGKNRSVIWLFFSGEFTWVIFFVLDLVCAVGLVSRRVRITY